MRWSMNMQVFRVAIYFTTPHMESVGCCSICELLYFYRMERYEISQGKSIVSILHLSIVPLK